MSSDALHISPVIFIFYETLRESNTSKVEGRIG